MDILFALLLSPIPYIVAILILLGLTRMMWIRKVHIGWISVLWLVGPVLFLYGPTWWDRLSNAVEYCAKTGRVIDVLTGEGMPGIYVIAEGSITESAIHTGTQPEYRLVVRTDAKGNYSIPSTWQYAVSPHNFWPTLFIGSSRHEWAVTPLMPGYIQPQDESHLLPANGNAENRIFIDNSNPPHRWNFFKVEVLPLQLKKYDLSAAQAVVYYELLATTRAQPRQIQFEMNRELVDYLFAKVCTDANGSKTAIGVAGGLSMFLGATTELKVRKDAPDEGYQRELKRLEPLGFQANTTAFESSNRYQYFLSKNVCEAFKLGTAP